MLTQLLPKPKNVLIVLFILLIVYVLAKTFNLALTGDDYLGYWRYETLRETTPLAYFFTDYGPQDYVTVIIHSFFGFEPRYYYYVAFILRTLAALSFYPLVRLLSKSKFASALAIFFFYISFTGAEVLDWSFNMPSYIGIVFMNISFYFYFQSLNLHTVKHLLLSYLFFIISILIQPLRMASLVFIYPGLAVFWTIVEHKKKFSINIFTKTIPLFVIFALITRFTKIGEAVSIRGTEDFSRLVNNFVALLQTSEYKILLNPIAQIGNIIFPTYYIPHRLSQISEFESLIITVFFLIFFSFSFTLLLKLLNEKVNIKTGLLFVIGILWTLIVWNNYLRELPQIQVTQNILGLFIGGYFLILTLVILIYENKNKKVILPIILALAIICFSFLAPWIRSPNEVQMTHSRYLIVSSAGLAIYLSGICMASRNQLIFRLIVCIVLVVNLFAVNKYLSYLSIVRDSKLTQGIRHSIPAHSDGDEPLVYYFEADNPDILYHSIMFGFPVIMMYENNMANGWGAAYTTSWAEVASAYADGQSLARFGTVHVKPVKIENIYSFKVRNGTVEDISMQSREKLLKETMMDF